MDVFYGPDAFLINQKIKALIQKKVPDNKYQSFSFTVEKDNLISNLEQIKKIVNHEDLFENNEKIIIITDFSNFFGSDKAIIDYFKQIKNYTTNHNWVILKIYSNSLKINNKYKGINFHLINFLNEKQFISNIEKRIQNLKIDISETEKNNYLQLMPKNLMYNNQELNKLSLMNQRVTSKVIKKITKKYFSKNVEKLVFAWLNNQFDFFWNEYRNYWERSNYDIFNIFLIATYNLVLIRNVKILEQQKEKTENICQILRITNEKFTKCLLIPLTISEINNLLIKAFTYEQLLKNSKIDKETLIVLYFLRI